MKKSISSFVNSKWSRFLIMISTALIQFASIKKCALFIHDSAHFIKKNEKFILVSKRWLPAGLVLRPHSLLLQKDGNATPDG